MSLIDRELTLDTRHIAKHLPNTPQMQQLVQKEGSAHVFNDKKLHATCAWGVFGHGESGMGHGEEATLALCPVPQATERNNLVHATCAWGVERRFQ
jgi:hypothetical protein